MAYGGEISLMELWCKLCGKEGTPVAGILGVCRECMIRHWDEAKPFVENARKQSREEFDLPQKKNLNGSAENMNLVPCEECVNQCKIPPGNMGFCAMKENRSAKLHYISGTQSQGFVDYYYDPLPTNCVAAWVCGERNRKKTQIILPSSMQDKNLAVFYQSCTFDCLFCQNWQYRVELRTPRRLSARELAAAADPQTRCVCYFGGDPASQMGHCIAASAEIMEQTSGSVRICWETNGSSHPRLMQKAAEIALATGGTIKIELKAFTPEIHYALTGCSNAHTLENIRMLASMMKERPDPPILCVSTLLVPGYISRDEVRLISRFLADCNPSIPFALLAFYPTHLFPDLPLTSRDHAQSSEEAAREQGITNIHIGNLHLLSREDYPC